MNLPQDTESPLEPPRARELWLGALLLFALACAVMVWLYGPGLAVGSRYHLDLTQSPHWMAYHTDAFAQGDLMVHYATFNESPLQNAIYWVGTLFVGPVLLNKLVGIFIFAFTSVLFYLLVSSMSGLRVGTLAALLFMVFPRSTYDIAGGFSKSWAIALVLIALTVVERKRWRPLVWLMPLAAVAYPVAAVQVGAIVTVGLAFVFIDDAKEGLRGLKFLAIGSGLAGIPLLLKYVNPSERIGEMISTEKMKWMWEQELSSSYTLPLWEEALIYVDYPFFFYGAGILLMALAGRAVWRRSWTAVVIASVISYYVSAFVVPRLYLPDRYVRFSIAVLCVLWFAHAAVRVLGALKNRWAYFNAVALLLVVAGLSFPETFRPSTGTKEQGIWQNSDQYVMLSRAVAGIEGPMLLAGHPMTCAAVVVQARRPVLVIHRMFHPWYDKYYREVDTRIRDTFRAFFARDVAGVNAFGEKYGVTHIAVPKGIYDRSRRKAGDFYKKRYDDFFAELAEGPANFILARPPRESVLYEGRRFRLVELPLPGTERGRQ